MYAAEGTVTSYWWIVPLVMMFLCFLMMRGRRGAMMCGFGSRNLRDHQRRGPDTAKEMLDKRYASGEIDKNEYEEIKRTIANGPEEISG
jgi:uncharacterized membrane protein